MKVCSHCGKQYPDGETAANCPACHGAWEEQTTARYPAGWHDRLGSGAAEEPDADAPSLEEPTVAPAPPIRESEATAEDVEPPGPEAPMREAKPVAPPLSPVVTNPPHFRTVFQPAGFESRAAVVSEPSAQAPAVRQWAPTTDFRPPKDPIVPAPREAAPIAQQPTAPETSVAEPMARPISADSPPLAPEDVRQDDDISDPELAAIKASGRFTIGLLGYPASGKTWFLNRLKRRYERPRGGTHYLVDPPPVAQGEIVDSTVYIEKHSFTCVDRRQSADRAEGSKARSFYVIDIPGERFLRAVEARFRGEQAHGLIRALAVCDALVVMLPAEELLAPPEALGERRRAGDSAADEASADAMTRQLEKLEAEIAELPPSRRMKKGPQKDAARAREKAVEAQMNELRGRIDQRRVGELDRAHRQLGLFVSAVVRLSAAASLLGKPKDDGAGVWTPDDLLRVSDETFQSLVERLHAGDRTPPVYAALSKSDHINNRFRDFLKRRGLILDLDDFDKDPSHLVRAVPEDLHDAFTGAFTYCRFDFLTAFAEHQEGVHIDYELEHYGVQAVIDWIDWARRREHTPPLLRWDTGAARTFKRLRDAIAPPPLIDADADYDDDAPPSGAGSALGWPGRAGAAVLDSAFGGTRLGGVGWSLGVVLVVGLVCAWLLGLLPFGLAAGSAPPITPKMAYPIELQRMAETAPLIDKGKLAPTLHAWSEIPDDGFLFSVAAGAPTRQTLGPALDGAHALEASQQVSASDADQLIARFKAADDTLASANGDDPARAIVDYHEGLLDAWSGRGGDAQNHFKAVLDRTGKLRGGSAAALSLPSKARLDAVEAATRDALGVSLLQGDHPDLAAAATQFKQAATAMGLTGPTAKPNPFAPTSGAVVAVDPTDIAANLVATDIRIDAGGGSAADKTAAESDLKSDLAAWQDDADQITPHPALAASLVAAALRVGDAASAARFAPQPQTVADADRDDVTQLANVASLAFGPTLTNAGDLPWPDRDWAYTRSWRTLFAAHDVARLRSSLAAVSSNTGAPARDLDYLQRWQSQVAHTAALEASGPTRREIVRGYAPLFVGDDQDVLNDARAPFGTLGGYGLTAVAVLAGAALLAAFWWVRGTYWRLFGARHRADRLKRQRG